MSEITKFRKDPTGYAEVMLQLRDCYNEKVLTFPGSGMEVETVEGVAALECCLEDLYNASPLPPLIFSEAISGACTKHMADLQENDFCSHIGTDGSTPEERLSKFGEQREQCGENIVFSMRSPQEIVWQMLIDDGSPERGHRANLLNMDFHFVGVAFGPHPSTETLTILLLVDHFRPKKMDALTRMQNIAAKAAGQGAQDPHEKAAGWADYTANWRKVLAEIRPPYLCLTKEQADSVDRLCQPVRRAKSYPAKWKTPRFAVGMLIPTTSVDPSIVRGFVHRLDKEAVKAPRDDSLDEAEVIGIVTQHANLGMTPDDVVRMFEEILERRPTQHRHTRAATWREIHYAMKTRKKWTPVVDLAVEGVSGTAGPRAGVERYEIVVELRELLRWAREVYREHKNDTKDLVDPYVPQQKDSAHKTGDPRPDSPSSPRGDGEQLPSGSPSSPRAGSKKQGEEDPSPQDPEPPQVLLESGVNAKQLMQLNAFMRSLVVAGERLPRLLTSSKVQGFLKRPEDVPELLAVKPRVFKTLVAMNPRRLWSYHVRPFREKWLRLFEAVGMKAVLPLPPGQDWTTLERPIAQRIHERVQFQQTRNLAKPDKVPYHGLQPGLGGVKEVKPKPGDAKRLAKVRSLRPGDQYPANPNRVKSQDLMWQEVPLKPWEEARQQVEAQVNRCFSLPNLHGKSGSERITAAASRSLGTESAKVALGPGGAVASVPFAAKRSFSQVLGKEKLLSEERQSISAERALEELEFRLLEGGEEAVAEMRRQKFSGAHPVLALSGGLIGHYHNSVTAHKHVRRAREGEYPRSYPQTRPGPEKSTDIRWDGHHIDGTKDDPAIEYVREWSKMPKEERDKFWYTGPYRLPDITDQKRAHLDGRRDVVGKWKQHRIHEFRDDVPARYGKFGRRVFDTQVKAIPLKNPDNVAELETKPQEEYHWQQERMLEYFDRQLPPGQRKHFEQYLPPCQQAWKELEMSNRQQMRELMNGRSELGCRLSDFHLDFKVYSRPLGASQMDKVVALGPAAESAYHRTTPSQNLRTQY